MMQRTDEDAVYLYAENSDLQMLSMPYEHTTGKELSMVVLLPRADSLTTTEASLNAEHAVCAAAVGNAPARNGVLPEVYSRDQIFPA